MKASLHNLSKLYSQAHNAMRSIDGLHPQEAFDELLKFLFFKQANEDLGPKLLIPSEIWFDGLFKQSHDQLASEIRVLFSKYVTTFNSWFHKLWEDGKFHLSNQALLTLCQMFREIHFSQVPFDTRSAALKEFLSPEIRRGLGIYLTPDNVVKMMVRFVKPALQQTVYDPACGSGTFLIETLKLRKQFIENSSIKNTVWGTDKNPRMLLLAELNIGHFAEIVFHRRVVDALYSDVEDEHKWPQANSFDIIFTNPPFGVSLDNTLCDFRKFQTCRTRNGHLTNRQQSEVVFIEQSLYYLKPGGTLAIVLPKSVVTNSTLQTARKALDKLGYIYAVMNLPSETFATAGTQASTIVLFIHKFDVGESHHDTVSIAYAEVTNVGYDATGRSRQGNQLVDLAQDLNLCLQTGNQVGICKRLPETTKSKTFSELTALLVSTHTSDSDTNLRDVAEYVTTGKTPSRKSYVENGLFVVKVGNLTGNGINWAPRERNFVSLSEISKRARKKLILQKNDILLTSSAHNPSYIAKKVDIVDTIPEWIGGKASLVGEVMLIRPNQDIIDPYILLAYLRSPGTMRQIQSLIRGQTAHLYPRDILEMPVPPDLLNPNETIQKAANLLRAEAGLNRQLNDIAYEQSYLLNNLSFAT